MVRCMFASCSSDRRKTAGVEFFRVPHSKQPNIAQLWLNRSKRADLSFEQLVSSNNYVVCSKHFTASQLVPYGSAGKHTVMWGEVPSADSRTPASGRSSRVRGVSNFL